jgi:hypothetical protein
MSDISSMRERITYLKRAAAEFRRIGELSAEPVRARLFELSDSCDEVAANIERNLPNHASSD